LGISPTAERKDYERSAGNVAALLNEDWQPLFLQTMPELLIAPKG
jgi:hypothetical protein